MNGILYRKATLDDVEILVKLRQQQLQEEGAIVKNDISQNLSNYFSNNIQNGSFICWLATCDYEIIATSGIFFYQVPPHYGNITGFIGHIANMHTLKSYRRKGIAKYLLSKVIDEARLIDYQIIRVNASKVGEFLYKDFGFYEKDNLFEYRIS